MPTDAQYHRLLPAFGHKAMCRRLGVSAGLTRRYAVAPLVKNTRPAGLEMLEGRCSQRSGSRKRLPSNKRAIAQHGVAKPAEPAEPAEPAVP
jgi:hypothetical protein